MTMAAGVSNAPGHSSSAESTIGSDERARTIRGIIVYLVLTAGLSAIFWRMMIAGKTLAPGGASYYVFALMWCPAVAGFATRLLFQRSLRGVGWGLPPRFYGWAGYWIPIAYASAVYVPLWIAGYGNFQVPAVQKVAGWVHVAPGSALSVVAYIVFVGTAGMVLNSFAALGEELGWRGFLVPELAKVTSFGRVAFLSGLIWATWHVPLIVGADYHGANPAWYSLVCFGVMVISTGYVAAWIRLKSGSVWPAMLLHASHNLFVQAIFDPLTRSTPFTNYAIGEFGAGLAIAAFVVALIVWRSRPRTSYEERVAAGNG